MTTLTEIPGIGPALAERLESAGVATVPQVASSPPEALAEVQGVSFALAERIIAYAAEISVASATGKATNDKVASEQLQPDLDRVVSLERKVKKLEAKNAKLRKALAKSKKASKSSSSNKSKKHKKSKKRKKK